MEKETFLDLPKKDYGCKLPTSEFRHKQQIIRIKNVKVLKDEND
jgi:hypothetical protein